MVAQAVLPSPIAAGLLEVAPSGAGSGAEARGSPRAERLQGVQPHALLDSRRQLCVADSPEATGRSRALGLGHRPTFTFTFPVKAALLRRGREPLAVLCAACMCWQFTFNRKVQLRSGTHFSGLQCLSCAGKRALHSFLVALNWAALSMSLSPCCVSQTCQGN